MSALQAVVGDIDESFGLFILGDHSTRVSMGPPGQHGALGQTASSLGNSLGFWNSGQKVWPRGPSEQEQESKGSRTAKGSSLLRQALSQELLPVPKHFSLPGFPFP